MQQYSILITMAGRGERFRRAGFRVPKFMVEVRGRCLFDWALDSLSSFAPVTEDIVFACLGEHDAGAFVRSHSLTAGFPEPQIYTLDELSDGQATTALLAGVQLRHPDLPLIIYNIDTYVEPWALSPSHAAGDGWIPCFEAEGDHWSFAVIASDGAVLDVAEKRRISSHATVGLYHFSSFHLYRRIYQHHYRPGARLDANERYIAPLYRTLLDSGARVTATVIPAAAVHALGTPEEVAAFERDCPVEGSVQG